MATTSENYELTVEQLEQINKEVCDTQPMVGELVPVESLVSAYENEWFQRGISNIAGKYDFLRKIRGVSII